MAQKSVRIWFKKTVKIDRLTFRQRDTLRIGSAGLLDFKRRVSQGLNTLDQPAKPLSKRYAIRKSRLRRGNRRDLWFTGKMLSNLTIRTVSDKRAVARLTSAKDRLKAAVNQRRERWLAFSPANTRAVLDTARKVLAEAKKRMIIPITGR